MSSAGYADGSLLESSLDCPIDEVSCHELFRRRVPQPDHVPGARDLLRALGNIGERTWRSDHARL